MSRQNRAQRAVARGLRSRRVRAKVAGTPARPRLVITRSLKHIAAQIIDDTTGTTFVAAYDRELTERGTPIIVAGLVGELIGKKAKEKNVQQVVFDRHGYRYHGRVKALADGARKAGLTF